MVALHARDLTVALGNRPVLDDVSARFDGGALIGIIGPNGAGKSTLVRALLGLVPPASGSVTLDDAPLATIPRAKIARHIAYLPQGQTLHWPLTVERIVALGRLPHLAPFSRLSDADVAAVERAMATTDVLHLRDRTATDLSGGERARVLLARALAVEAPALIVDEPLASLDPGHQLEIMALLAGLAATGTLVIAVLHDLGLAARHCDRLLLVDRGRIAGDGPPRSVLTPEALSTAFGIQAWIGEVGGADVVVPLRRSD
jgi:iron complex transport system ATP-binding protein